MSGQLEEISDSESDTSFFSPMQDEGPSANVYLKSRMRKSLSLDSLVTKPEDSEKTVDIPPIEKRRPASRAYNQKKAPSQELINKLAQPKRFSSAENLTLAEAVKKFQVDTPKRFRSRAPPNKAHPINKEVMKGPMKPPAVEKKPPTAIEPFKLAEVKKTAHFEVEKIPPFKAKPLPKYLQNPFKLQANSKQPTVPQTSSFVKKLNKNLPKIESREKVETDLKPFKPSVTQPQPFSFEERDKVMQKKKEELVNRILEEEKKACEFHAKPPPKAILRACNKNFDDVAGAKQKRNEEIDTVSTFKAKSPTVLRVEPFQPKKDDHHDVKIEPFQLSIDQRAHSRQKFENWFKEKQLIKESLRKENEELAKKREEQEVAQLRKQTEYKAQPIKKYKEVKILKSNKVTTPISPVFHTDRLRNKENIEH